ncbi:hypothetical protein [Paenibacillus xylanexedens]|uniref:hypothetical protein n=1 Tax=Paenibacillus xylanexedens TaxID=528191 RepID=UPI0011A78AA5|nr:hypothetical protein [Paenibacillus xylanexedens]
MDEELRKRLGLPDIKFVRSGDEADLDEAAIVFLDISREHVEKGRLEQFLREFARFSKKKMRGKISLGFNGYDDDPREVYQIPEIRSWTKRLVTNVPHIFYLLNPDAYGMKTVLLCTSNVVGRVGDTTMVETASGKAQIEKLMRSALNFSKKAGEPAAVQFQLANEIIAATDYENMK